MGRVALRPLVGRSYLYVASHAVLFLQIGWFWFALTVVLGAAVSWAGPRGPMRYIGEFIDIPPLIAFAVAWHRATLLGERPRGAIGGRLGGREARYMGWVLLLMLAAFLVMVLGAISLDLLLGSAADDMLQIDVILLLLFAVIFLATRFILLLPGVALGDPRAGLGWSWRLTRGHGFRLFLAFCTVSLPLLVLKYALIFALGLPLGEAPPAGDASATLLLEAALRLIDFVNMAVSVAFMSFAYRAFTRI